MANPFIIKTYASKDTFCDREQELGLLLNNLRNDADTTIISQRRIGKTGLIYRLIDEIKSEKINIVPIYIDIYASQSIADFIKLTAEAVLKAFPEKSSIGKHFLGFVKSLRPLITFDSITGEPQIHIAYRSTEEKAYTLNGLYQLLDEQGCRIMLAYDEFQQIREYPEKNMEELLRTYMQPLHNIHFIFCGSKRHVMADIFMSAKRPFYSSTNFLSLDRISAESYGKFIKRLFSANGRTIDDEAVTYILHWTKRHTYYTQSLCHTIFADGAVQINVDEVKRCCNEIMQQNEAVYMQYRQMLTTAQWNYLIAMAKEEEVTQITSKDFLSKYSIGTPSTSRRLMESLTEKELIIDNVGKSVTTYSVYDVFFSRWLARVY